MTKPKAGYTPEQKAARAEYDRSPARAEQQRRRRSRPEARAANVEYQRRYRDAHREEKDEYNRRYRATSEARAAKAENRRRLVYGLTLGAYEAMLVAQGGRCAACNAPMQAPQVDHCHETGKIREILCGDCNTSAGRLRDDPSRYRALADYLERHAA